MSSPGQRLWRIGAVYALGFVALGVHFGGVMLASHDDWLVRSYRNRWAFKDVPSVRGKIVDRFDREIAHDEPTFELECVYERFRILHPVGAAVHGATLASRSKGGEVRYSYTAAGLGPDVAAADLLSLPVGALLSGSIGADPMAKEERRELIAAATTVLAAAGGRSRGDVWKDLRRAARENGRQPLMATLTDLDQEQVLAGFQAVLVRLRSLDRALAEFDIARRDAPATAAAGGTDEDGDDPIDAEPGAAADPSARPIGLLARLERFRIDSLDGRRTRHEAADGSVRDGELLERLARPIARNLPFPLAAALRVAADDQPGLRLEPALRRLRAKDLGSTLGQILGRVAEVERTPDPKVYVDSRVAEVLGGELEEFLPDELMPSPIYREELVQQAQSNYARVLRTRERRGQGGIEAMLDDELAGSPGMRLVERDARAREQRLWSSLRVEGGRDVALTIDLDLQHLLEHRVEAATERWQSESQRPQGIDVAMTIVDAVTGDVLALASAPTTIDGKPRVPAALAWRGTGALGSIVKPFVLLEQLAADREGRPHQDLQQLEACARNFRGPDRHVYRCDSEHGERGRDPVEALAASCNVFFFQLALGLQEDGLRRGLWRFGLLPPPDGVVDDGRFLPRPKELPAALAAAPRWSGRQALPMRGIGYGLEANPLSLAAAYAALATGRLPTLGLQRGKQRPTYPTLATDDDLALVRAGLRACVEHGTADKIEGLATFGVLGKTGTAEIAKEGAGRQGANNAWFAGFLPAPAGSGIQLAFCAVVYAVPHGIHGADAAGLLVADVLTAMSGNAAIAQRYLVPGSGR